MTRPYSASSEALKLDGDAVLFDDQLGSDAMRDRPRLYAISLQILQAPCWVQVTLFPLTSPPDRGYGY
jgi:hypothetical protein